jgi:hypothetical protein
MDVDDTVGVVHGINRLVDDYRTRCLWYLRPDYYPATDAERLRLLAAIQRCGDRAAHVRAAALRRCRVCRIVAENRIAAGDSYVAARR